MQLRVGQLQINKSTCSHGSSQGAAASDHTDKQIVTACNLTLASLYDSTANASQFAEISKQQLLQCKPSRAVATGMMTTCGTMLNQHIHAMPTRCANAILFIFLSLKKRWQQCSFRCDHQGLTAGWPSEIHACIQPIILLQHCSNALKC
jgi:hypothetical protein